MPVPSFLSCWLGLAHLRTVHLILLVPSLPLKRVRKGCLFFLKFPVSQSLRKIFPNTNLLNLLVFLQKMQMEEFSVTKDASNLKCPSYTALLMSSAKSPGKVATDSAQELPISGNDSAASALSDQTPSKHLDLASTDCNTRKRKAHSMTKEAAENDEKKGCYNADEDIKEKDSTNVDGKGRNSSDSAESCPKQAPDKKTPAPPPKQDYIHVRARRGQATDSHSLAERVRREKISERMRILQELVPGCNKITGKAVMLDEIINYVQSLQRQVEFLSMKLAAVNPLPDFHMDEVSLPKDIWQPYCTSAMPVPDKMIASIQHQQPQSLALEHDMQCKPDEHSISEASVQKMIDPQFHCINGPSDLIYQNMQVSHIWDNELENGVNPRLYNPTKSTHMTSQGFQELLSTGHMKVEL